MQIAKCKLQIGTAPGPPPPTTSSRAARVGLLLASCVAIVAVLPAAQGDLPAELPDPLPLRRLLIAPERVPAEMKRVEQGVLIHMTREDFEDQVRRAALSVEASKRTPRLVEARYRARLVDSSLVGSGQWKIINPTPEGFSGKTILPLAPMNLAIRQPRFENRDALVAAFDGKGLGLLLEQR